MTRKWLLNALAVLFLVAGLFSSTVHAANTGTAPAEVDVMSKIEPDLLTRFSLDGTADIIVRFSEQADLSPAYGMDWDARGEFVYSALKETAAHSQGSVKVLLDKAGYTYETFIAGNELYVDDGNLDLATRLAALDDVAYLYAAKVYHYNPIVVENPMSNVHWSGDLLSFNLNSNLGAVDATLAWGIADVKADQFWAAFGVRGDNIRVANIDGGVDWNHPALIDAFACKDDPTNPACFLDAYKECGDYPCDLDGHGTHTMGTMVANDDPSLPYVAGMAPNATWIACRACTATDCTAKALNSCADWMLAPGGDPANRPNVLNNSWGGGSGNDWYLDKVEAWRAAGIFPAFSAGNEGPECDTLGSPGDYQESFASAAHDAARNIAAFSSRGPSAFGDDPYTKPNISGPGVSVCSTVPDDAWTCGYSGTSMASPHSAGAVALLWSCNPDLIGDIDTTFQILQNSTDTAPEGTCGAPADGEGNYTFGYGYLNVLTAGESVCGGEVNYGTIEGYVVDNFGNPVEGASVIALPSIQSAVPDVFTDPDGYYSMELVATTYELTASKVNYVPETKLIEVIGGVTTTVPDFVLEYLGSWTELDPLPGCPDWMRYDGEYFAPDGLVYFLGGRIDASATDPSIYALDPAIGECTDTGADMFMGVSNYTIVPLNVGGQDVLCTFGGRDVDAANTDIVQCYDPVANVTTQVTTLPASMAGYTPGGAASVNGKAYVFGGLNLSAEPYAIAETWEWDPATDTWTQLGDLGLEMGYLQVAVVDDLIYAFGGNTFDGTNLIAQKVAAVLDPATGTWTSIRDMPMIGAEGRAYGFDSDSAYELAGKIVIAGGGVWPEDTYEVFTYDVAADTYDLTFFNLNITRRSHAGVFVPGDPGTMWVFGGISSAVGYGGDNPPYGPPEYLEVELTQPMIHDIEVNPLLLDETVLVDTPKTVVLQVMNVGTGSLEWTISEGLTDVPWLAEDPASGTDTTDIDVTFDPTGMAAGAYYATLEIASNDVDEPLVSVPVTMTVVDFSAGVALTPEAVSQSADPGTVVEYHLVLENTGEVADTYNLTATGAWATILSATAIDLDPGVTADVTVQVTIPADALAGADDLAVVTATSTINPSVSASSELTTIANTVHAFTLTPAIDADAGNPGDIIIYNLTLTNLGNISEVITLDYSGNLWDVNLPLTTINLAVGVSVEVVVQVTIPEDAVGGDLDQVSIVATAESGGEAVSILNTSVLMDADFLLSLPIVFK